MDILSSIMKKVESFNDELARKFKLRYNPFPKSGIAIINDSDKVIEKLEPVDDIVRKNIYDFIQDALSANFNPTLKDDKYISLVVRGEYGSGKTQTLMYIKYLLKSIKSEKIKPYVVYIDNPGEKLSQLIGEIVSQIGVENFKKYLWDIFLKYLDDNPNIKITLTTVSAKDLGLFSNQEEASEEVSLSYSNYKQLIDKLTLGRTSSEIKAVMGKMKDYLIKSYLSITDSPTVASTFCDIVSETVGVSKSWDLLTSGSVKELDKREVDVLRAIVRIVCDQMGYTDFIILIDEFEEITAERLKKSEVDNYAIESIFKKITNQIYKLLPMREENGDWKKPLETIMEELAGMDRMLGNQVETFASLLFKLEGLFSLVQEDDFQLYRRTIFECLSICGSLKEGLVCQD